MTYMVVGPYSEDYGWVEESCNPYRANQAGVCETNVNCRKYYFTNHHYVGGYYGAYVSNYPPGFHNQVFILSAMQTLYL